MKQTLFGKKAILGFSVAALALGGVAIAKDHGPGKDPMAGKTVTRAEAQAHATEMFAKMDLTKDGKLDTADRDARHMARFDKADANKDGAISRDEFTAGRKAGGEGAMREHRMGEGKGEHGKREHGMRMGRHGGGMGGGMMILAMADTNKDKAVSKDEFLAAHAKHFDGADANKDGKLTPEERKAAHAKMRDHMKSMRGKDGGMGAGHEGHMPPPPPPAN